MSSEQHIQSLHKQIAKIALAMLDGEMSYLLGARILDALRHQVSADGNDADFMVFVAVASETDDFPLGSVREHWDKQALDKLQPEIDAAEAWAKGHAEQICAKLVSRFS